MAQNRYKLAGFFCASITLIIICYILINFYCRKLVIAKIAELSSCKQVEIAFFWIAKNTEIREIKLSQCPLDRKISINNAKINYNILERSLSISSKYVNFNDDFILTINAKFEDGIWQILAKTRRANISLAIRNGEITNGRARLGKIFDVSFFGKYNKSNIDIIFSKMLINISSNLMPQISSAKEANPFSLEKRIIKSPKIPEAQIVLRNISLTALLKKNGINFEAHSPDFFAGKLTASGHYSKDLELNFKLRNVSLNEIARIVNLRNIHGNLDADFLLSKEFITGEFAINNGEVRGKSINLKKDKIAEILSSNHNLISYMLDNKQKGRILFSGLIRINGAVGNPEIIIKRIKLDNKIILTSKLDLDLRKMQIKGGAFVNFDKIKIPLSINGKLPNIAIGIDL